MVILRGKGRSQAGVGAELGIYGFEIMQQGLRLYAAIGTHMKTMTKRILTGGAGFLGSHFCERLVAQGHEVPCLDNVFTGTKDNVRPLLKHPGSELMRHDILPALRRGRRDLQPRLPGLAHPLSVRPGADDKTSVHAAIKMLGLAERVKAKISQPATSEVNGNPGKSIRKARARVGSSAQKIASHNSFGRRPFEPVGSQGSNCRNVLSRGI
jgi:hypothetical protein